MAMAGLVLHTARGSGPGTAPATWRGPSELTQHLRGLDIGTAARTVSLLHGICPFAHGVAFLRGAERAAGSAPDEIQESARDALCLVDTLASQVWRHSVAWPKLEGAAPDLAAAAAARQAAREVCLALFPEGDWARPGGGAVQPNATQLADAVSRIAAHIIPTEVAGPEPGHGRLSLFIAKRFRTMARAPRQTLERLRQQIARVSETAARAFPSSATGIGRGSARTARGPVIYTLELDQGEITSVHVSPPSARRFADHGVFSRVVAKYAPVTGLDRLAAAFDPCADVVFAEAGYA